eukprot:CAMPEP_0113679684 /NCGR_PEP_ID=MMETSP0038_2-20120614/10806_1 /TAXON_ID=2898 /ORGANISM="Cryptomonas paramecium" /LENGTH=1270 /DNA_ID=CAMNT_0000597793 /DNA_START=83 /DNA_END=3891 /DNA_ORIENTATION=- /assembly_acc=CAM_ASM_000170
MESIADRLERLEKTAAVAGLLKSRIENVLSPTRDVQDSTNPRFTVKSVQELRNVVREEIAIAYSRHTEAIKRNRRAGEYFPDKAKCTIQADLDSECPHPEHLETESYGSKEQNINEYEENVENHSDKEKEEEGENDEEDEGEILERELFARVESKAAFEKLNNIVPPKSIKHNVRSLDDATEQSLPALLGGFSRESRFRNKCFQIHTSLHWKALFIVVNFANCLVIAAYPEFNRDEFNSEGTSTRRMAFEEQTPSRHLLSTAPTSTNSNLATAFEVFCASMMFFEIATSCVAVGLIGHPTSFINSSHFHKLDFLILILTILEYFLLYTQGISYFTFRAFRLLRLLKPLLSMAFFNDVKEILETLAKGATQLFIITSVMVLLLLAFCVMGMAMYQKSLSRRCVKLDFLAPTCSIEAPISNWSSSPLCNFSLGDLFEDVVVAGGQEMVMAGYPFEEYCKIYYNSTPHQYDKRYPLDPFGHYHDCGKDLFDAGEPVDSTCIEYGNPNNGFQNFDNMIGTLLVLTQVFIADGGVDVMGYALASEPDLAGLTVIYFFLVTFIITWIVLSLFVAVVVNTFQEVRNLKEHDAREKQLAEKQVMRLQVENLPTESVEDLQKSESDGSVLLAVWASGILNHPYFNNLLSCTILMHIMAMAFDQDTAAGNSKNSITTVYIVSNALFGVELIFRFAACGGSKDFFNSGFHLLELFLLACGLIGLQGSSRLLNLIPSIRLLRLCQYWPTLNDLLMDCVISQRAFVNLILFIALVCLCFAVAGRYIFRSEMNSQTRSHFGDLAQAILTIFQIFAGEGWSDVLFNALAVKPDIPQQTYACLFILTWLFIAKIIFTGVIVAVICENFKVEETVRLIKSPGQISKFRELVKHSYQKLHLIYADVQIADYYGHDDTLVGSRNITLDPAIALLADTSGSQYVDYQLVLRAASAPAHKKEIHNEAVKFMDDDDESTLFMFGPKNRFRLFCDRIRRNNLFNLIIYISIGFSCVTLMVTPPAEDIPDVTSPFPYVMRLALDKALTSIFTVEFLVTIVSQGFILTKNAYMRSGWNVVDFVILVLSLVDLSGVFKGSISKIGRALRPLRLANRIDAVRELLEALFATLPPMGYVIWLWMMFLVVFALIGMGLFGGLMFTCSYGASFPQGKTECSGVEADLTRGIIMPRAWIVPNYNFDNTPTAILTLFRITYVNFVSNMFAVVDITYKNTSPSPSYSFHFCLYFIAYLLLAAFFIMNVFVAFISDGFRMNQGGTDADISYNKIVRQIDTRLPR